MNRTNPKRALLALTSLLLGGALILAVAPRDQVVGLETPADHRIAWPLEVIYSIRGVTHTFSAASWDEWTEEVAGPDGLVDCMVRLADGSTARMLEGRTECVGEWDFVRRHDADERMAPNGWFRPTSPPEGARASSASGSVRDEVAHRLRVDPSSLLHRASVAWAPCPEHPAIDCARIGNEQGHVPHNVVEVLDSVTQIPLLFRNTINGVIEFEWGVSSIRPLERYEPPTEAIAAIAAAPAEPIDR